MKNLLTFSILSLFFIQFISAEYDTIYVDPDYSGTSDGSIQNPYTNFTDLKKEDSTVYMLKGGVMHSKLAQVNDVKHIEVNSYGGSRAILHSLNIARCKFVTVKNIELYSSGQWSKALVFHSNADPELNNFNITVDSIEIHGQDTAKGNCYYGIYGGQVTNLKITNSVIHHTRQDGVYLSTITNFEFTNNHIYNVNMNNGAGDGMQFLGRNNNINIHNNIIDRSGSMSKFCIIMADGDISKDIRITNNVLIGPDDGNSGAVIFLGVPSDPQMIIRGNIIKNGPTGIYAHTNANIGHNVFIGNGTGISNQSGFLNIGNNVFYNNKTAISVVDDAGKGLVKNNIFYLADISQKSIVGLYSDIGNNMQNIAGDDDDESIAEYTDPLFVDAANHDFHLQVTSPAIDAGLDINFDYDFEGNINHCNGTPDIGAFEYQNNCSAVQNYPPVIAPPSNTILFGAQKYILDLSNSHDPDDAIDAFYWTFPDLGDYISYTDNESIVAMYAPEVIRDTTIYIYAYVSDGRLNSDTAKIEIKVKGVNSTNNTPIAIAGKDITTNSSSKTVLNGTESYDIDNDDLLFFWSTDYAGIDLINATTATPYFYAPNVEITTDILLKLKVTDGIAFSSEDVVVVKVKPGISSINDSKISNSVLIFPNPVTKELKIDITDNYDKAMLSIVNIMGQLVHEGTIESGINTINLSSIKSGYYILQIVSNNQLIHKGSFVKE